MSEAELEGLLRDELVLKPGGAGQGLGLRHPTVDSWFAYAGTESRTAPGIGCSCNQYLEPVLSP
jgi:hypothetical protein